jgi:TldD protein
VLLIFQAALALAAADLEAMLAAELDRATQALATRPERPHYTAVAVTDQHEWNIAARSGTIAQSDEADSRYLDVDLRVGTPERDSTHELRGFSALEGDSRDRLALPIGDAAEAEYAIRRAVNTEIDRRYREGAERIVMVRANNAVKVEEEDPSPDFEPRTQVVARQSPAPLTVDVAGWERVLTETSKQLQSDPVLHDSVIRLQAIHEVKTFVDTEGTRLVHGRNGLRVSLQVQTTADDGDEVSVFESLDAHTPEKLPNAQTLATWARDAATRLTALRTAPRATPYSGPVLLAGRASAVLFHEVFGHRVEGHRQKRESEGKTFADYVNKPILPAFLHVSDDPTVAAMAGNDLNGFYAFDDEGVPAQRATLVKGGVFQGFLMSRSPITGFPHSNGHGRRRAGSAPVARMANTIVEATTVTPMPKLRQSLIEEAKKQGLAYGMLVEEIDGGFTLTGRMEPNAFNVRASASWRVYVDGRPDELVRGIDLVGTPLVAFGQIIAAGDDPQVFNGYCGAESGWVPVSGVAPTLLFRKLEFQLKEKGQDKPPLLVRPLLPSGSASLGGGAR